jgi:hypothetical protein
VTEESRANRTPNGGVRSTAYYLDAAGRPAEKGRHARVRIVEYDADGAPIHRTYLMANKSPAPNG